MYEGKLASHWALDLPWYASRHVSSLLGFCVFFKLFFRSSCVCVCCFHVVFGVRMIFLFRPRVCAFVHLVASLLSLVTAFLLFPIKTQHSGKFISMIHPWSLKPELGHMSLEFALCLKLSLLVVKPLASLVLQRFSTEDRKPRREKERRDHAALEAQAC